MADDKENKERYDRDKAREGLNLITDENERLTAAYKIEGMAHLESAFVAFFVARNKRYPQKEEYNRIFGAVKTLMLYEPGPKPTPEETARINSALGILEGELR